MRIGVVLIASALLATGCSSSSSSTPSSARITTPEASAHSNGLTGFGAARADWNAHHTADPDPTLISGCCYGPQIPFFGQSSLADTWAAVLDGGGIIDSFEHNFRPNTSRAQALTAVIQDDLPPDATLVSSKVGDGCELFLYKSATLGKAVPDLGPYISFDFVSPPDETVYYPSNIWNADLSGSTGSLGEC